MSSWASIPLPGHRQPIAVAETLARIDLDNLAREVSDVGPETVWWGIVCADAKHAAETAKLTLDMVDAELSTALRVEAVNKGTRVTEDGIKALVLGHPRHKAAAETYLAAKRNAEVLESAKYAVVQKARTLQELAVLIVAERRATDEGLSEYHPVQSRAAYRS